MGRLFSSPTTVRLSAIWRRALLILNRGKLVTYPGNYDQYLQEKEEALRVEELQNAEFDRKLAQEEVWIRQGSKHAVPVMKAAYAP